jgi:hypothetical protein
MDPVQRLVLRTYMHSAKAWLYGDGGTVMKGFPFALGSAMNDRY